MIANSLSITIAQRTREFATLRTIGASRRQILRSVLLESFVIGVLASVIGLFLGLGLAKLLFWIFEQVGFTLPNTGLLFKPRTVIVSLVVGIARDDDRQPAPGAARDARAADRGRARGRDAAAGALRASTAPIGSALLAVLGFLAARLRLFGAHGTGNGPRSSWASAPCSSSSASRSSPRS